MESEVRWFVGIPERLTQLTPCLLRPCILAHVSGTSAYGYDLRHSLSAIGLECDLGTVYRALNTMESEGLLSSTWERSESGRSRRRYELTLAGADTLETYATAVEQLVTVADAFAAMRRQTAAAMSAAEGDVVDISLPNAVDIECRMDVARVP